MFKESFLILDIETIKKPDTKEFEELLTYKTRNVPPERVEREKERYRFISPIYSNALCIGTLLVDPDGNTWEEQFFSREDEESIVKSFFEYIDPFKGRYVHFNGLDFDVPYLLFKSIVYGINPPQDFCNLIRFRTKPHYDVMQVITNWGKFPISLAETSLTLGISNPKQILESTNHDIIKFLLTASEDDIRRYNMEDVRSTYQAFKKTFTIFK